MSPQFHRLVFVERLAVFADPSNWLKMVWPLLPVSCTGAIASQFRANAKRIKPHMIRFRMLSLHERFNLLSLFVVLNLDEYKDVVRQREGILPWAR
jgi:hypothetical protein